MPQRARAALTAVSARGPRWTLPFVVIMAALLWLGAGPAHAEEEAFAISDERITESSGLAADPNLGGYWTVNDSGDGGIAYALDRNGDTTGTLEWQADPIDVEALALADNTLYVGDIGDNQGSREFVTVFFFTEPSPDGQRQYRAYDFRYPDGARDAEALLVDPNGRLYIVSKEETGGIYAAPEQPSREGVNELARVADAPAYVTDGVFLPDGRMALRTYVSVEVLDPADAFAVAARAALPLQPQGESIALELDSDALLVGSEGANSQVLRVAVPDSVGEAPDPPSSPQPSPSPTPEPSPSPSGEPGASAEPEGSGDEANPEAESDTEGRGRQGTWMAVGAALLVAVVAGAVVLGVRPRRPKPTPARAKPAIEEDPPQWDDWFADEDDDDRT